MPPLSMDQKCLREDDDDDDDNRGEGERLESAEEEICLRGGDNDIGGDADDDDCVYEPTSAREMHRANDEGVSEERRRKKVADANNNINSNTLAAPETSKNEVPTFSKNVHTLGSKAQQNRAKMRKVVEEAALADVMTDLDIVDNGYRNSPYVIVDGDGVLYSGAPKPRNEKERLFAVRASGILDVENKDANEYFDLLTSICATALSVPMCLVSILDSNRQVFKANLGINATETNRNSSFCAWTLLPKEPKVLLVEDAMQDFRFQTNDLVLGPSHLRFYAGAPIIVRGVRFGSFCVLDTKPRHDMSPEDLGLLTRCAKACAKTIEKTAMQMYFMDAIDDSNAGFMLVSLGSVSKGEKEDEKEYEEEYEEEEEPVPEEYTYNHEDSENMDDDEEELDAAMSIVYANEATKTLLGFSKEKKFAGESLYEIFSEASASGQIKPNSGEGSVDEFFEEILSDENGEKNKETGKMNKRDFGREFSILKEFSVRIPIASTEQEGDEGNEKNKTQTSSRHIRVELSRKTSTFRRVQNNDAKNSAPSPPLTPRAQSTTSDDENGDELNDASERLPKNLTPFHVIVVNITDITQEVNERIRLEKNARA